MQNKDEKYGIGKVFSTNKYGDIEIVEILSSDKRRVRFLNYDKYKVCALSQIRAKTLQIPDLKSKYEPNDVFYTKHGEAFKILRKIDGSHSVIQFMDEFAHECFVSNSNINTKNIKNPFRKRGVFGRFLGVYVKNEMSRYFYKIWHSMFERVELNDNYRNVSICEEWLNFSKFNDWATVNFPIIDKKIRFELDKDLLQQDSEFKIYSPDTCVFLPISVNSYINKKYEDVNFHKRQDKFRVKITDFYTKKEIPLGSYDDLKYCKELYKKARLEQHEKVKDYLRSLDYLPEEIIELVR